MNTGAEAVETALKTIRRYGYRNKKVEPGKAEIIVCKNNFHGRTITIISFTSDESYQKDFGPLTPGFKIISYNDINALKNAITPNTVAFLVEPIQGEGGILIPDDNYFKEVRKICDSENILLVMDEIQTGFGRTGKTFAYEHYGIKPDMLILGKTLGGGIFPVSAVASSKKILSVFEPGSHGSTFGGNPLACRVAREALKVLVDENLVEKSHELGKYSLEVLAQIKNPLIKEIRGRGLFIGIELKKEAGGARKYCEKLMHRGVLCKETHEDIIRIATPLTISKEDLTSGLEKIKKVLE